jgi:DNA-binding TFAR19-related protein (PDSD5 family)
MHNVEHHVGRLVEVRLASPLSADEVQKFVQELNAVLKKLPGKYVGLVDLHDAHVFPPAISESLIQLLSAAAARVERAAFLINESAIFALQVERILRSSNSENRKAFRNLDEAVKWLGDVMTPEERTRLKTATMVKPAKAVHQ